MNRQIGHNIISEYVVLIIIEQRVGKATRYYYYFYLCYNENMNIIKAHYIYIYIKERTNDLIQYTLQFTAVTTASIV